MNDAGFAVDARAFDDIVVEFVAFLLGDEGCHKGNTSIEAGEGQEQSQQFAIEMFYIG